MATNLDHGLICELIFTTIINGRHSNTLEDCWNAYLSRKIISKTRILVTRTGVKASWWSGIRSGSMRSGGGL
uniref:Uncharacterized protein n=1 Tax=Rhizophora mucronata TaxID=61149 RepID=A0A2P2P2P7_RHIMU